MLFLSLLPTSAQAISRRSSKADMQPMYDKSQISIISPQKHVKRCPRYRDKVLMPETDPLIKRLTIMTILYPDECFASPSPYTPPTAMLLGLEAEPHTPRTTCSSFSFPHNSNPSIQSPLIYPSAPAPQQPPPSTPKPPHTPHQAQQRPAPPR